VPVEKQRRPIAQGIPVAGGKMNHPTIPGTHIGRRIRRFQHVVNVLVKNGFAGALTRIRVWETGHIERNLLRLHPKVVHELSVGERIRLVFEELGPTFIKLGQMLSTRPDLVPADIILELKKLQLGVHFIPSDVVRKIIETELGRPIEQVFDSFEDKPLAAASLAQVHRAVYKGKQVVLKVQRPEVHEIAEMDIEIMRSLATLAERYSPTLYLINSVGLVEEFAQQIKKELDFLMEAHNLVRFARDFEGDETIHVPEAYLDLCTKRLVTMEFLDGINIADTRKLEEGGYDLPLIARRGAIVGFRAIFEFGFFHADPHPGNIMVMPGNVIGLVDFGMMATLSIRDRERLAKLMYFISMRDDKHVARALNELMESEDTIPSEDLEPSMTAIINEFGDLPSCEMHLARMLFAMMNSIILHGARLRPQLIWLTKSIASQEEMACSLEADFNLIDLGKPYAQKLLYQKLNPLKGSQDFLYWLVDVLDTMKDLPYDAGIIMREIRKGRIKIEFEHKGLDPIRRTMERMANRNALTSIIVALLISSSVIAMAKIPPFVGNLALLAFLGYLLAAFLGILLVYSIFFGSRR
jgi:ubiquinone biosynthesis protein